MRQPLRPQPALCRPLSRLAWFLLAAGAAFAQGTLTGPSLGLVYDPAIQAIRPILGIPGAASAGKRIDVGFAITAAAIAPSHTYALAVASDGSLKLITFNPDGPSTQPLASSGSPDRMILSPAGSSALLLYRSAAKVQVVTGLAGSPSVSPPIDISGLPQTPDRLAISDDGAVVLAGVIENHEGEPAAGAVFLIPQTGTAPRAIATVKHASAITFYMQSHDVLLADDVTSSLTMLQDAAGQAAPQWTFSDPGLAAPDSVQVSADRRTILAGSSTTGILAIVDATGVNSPVFLKCQCIPVELNPFKPASTYQLTEPANGLLWILDSSPGNARILFVPVPSGTHHSHSRRLHR